MNLLISLVYKSLHGYGESTLACENIDNQVKVNKNTLFWPEGTEPVQISLSFQGNALFHQL